MKTSLQMKREIRSLFQVGDRIFDPYDAGKAIPASRF